MVPQRKGDKGVVVWVHRGVLRREVGEVVGGSGLRENEIFVRITRINLVHKEIQG